MNDPPLDDNVRVGTPRTEEPDMASLTEQHTVEESRNQNQVQTAPCEPTTKNASEHCREYQREHPGVVVPWCFGIGFVLGWKVRVWQMATHHDP